VRTHTTSDYTIFRKLSKNREVRPKHVRRMAASLALANKMDTDPVVVTKDMRVIDGQHRLEACKILQIPVTYVIDDHFTERDLLARQTGRQWGMEDRVHYHSVDDPDWDRLVRAKEATGAPYSVLFALLGYTGAARTRKLFDGGQLADGDTWLRVEDYAQKIAGLQRWIKENTSIRHQRFYREWKFAKALVRLLDTGISWSKIEHKMQINWLDLTHQKSVDEYEALLRRIVAKRDRKA